ncbi:hypothetical protein O3M35_004771 [Rhynocoris fuscipes]|uniref:[histone H3]-trimethyl-L-lysine(4) demethylase n=1 Tax=Rhynocoris fuscipes TaxID=488301 RepID=A0AAW1DI37_9HEMI
MCVDINDIILSLNNRERKEEILAQLNNMESRAKEPIKATPRKGKSKFVFHPPPEAPVFRPTPEEFDNPLHYINSIKPLAEKCGICKIIPPAGWKSPFVLNMDKLKFTPRIQRINELEARTRIKLNFIDQLTKFFANRGKTFQIPLIEKTPLDLYTLHRCVRDHGGIENVTKDRKWNDIAVKMGFNGKGAPTSLKLHYEHLLHPFLLAQQEKQNEKLNNGNNLYFDERNDSQMEQEDGDNPGHHIKQLCHDRSKGASFRELQSLKFLGPGPKMAVFDGPVKTMKTRTRGKKILYEFDPLAKYMCKSCSNGSLDDLLVTCVSCEDRYHSSCLFPPLLEKPLGDWKCPKCIAIDVCKPLEEFGFAQAEREYTLTEFKEMADKFKQNYFKMTPNLVPTQKVEDEFWRVVSSIEEAVTVEYGADLHVIDHGSAFPIKGKYVRNSNIDQETFDKYADSSWNLNNLPVLKASVLRHISADISGMKIPWMYAGMCFATFCWHNEDHWSYSINYLHLGEPKTWYGVSGSLAEEFEEAMKNAAPELFESQPDILHQLVTIMNPNDIMAAGVPVYRTDQKEGEFVITFPRAYHAGFNQGFNFAEACNFAPYDWLAIGRECISHYSSLGRPCVFSHDELVCKMAMMADELDGNIAWATINDGKAMLNAERIRRHIITKQGVYKAVKIKFEELPDDERVCAVCNTTCFLSGVTCPCDESRLVCLEHVSDLCGCPYSVYIMKYEYQIDEIANMLMVLENKTLKFNTWLTRVEEALSGGRKPKISLCELTELLIEANDKEFPRNDLIAILHYQVSKCIEVSALARTILNITKKKSDSKKITIEELATFAKEIDTLPCILMEANAIKQLLNRAKHIQRIGAKNLHMKNLKVTKILNVLNWMESLNLDFKEIPLLQRKLKERTWIDKADELLSKKGAVNLELLEQHLKNISGVPQTNAVRSKKEALVKLKKEVNETWAQQVAARMKDDEVIDVDELVPDKQSIPVNTISKSTLSELDEVKNWQEKTLSILKGETVLSISEITEHLAKEQSFSFKIVGVEELRDNLKQAQNWQTVASKYFLKSKCPYTLLQAVWPRKFLSREYFFKTNNLIQLENMINEGDKKFTRDYYKSASSSQIRSLFKLRLDNLALRAGADPNKILCACGRVIQGEIVTCELCQTAYHRSCFRVDENVVKSFIYGFRAKIMCSLCTRTKRPSLLEANNLLLSGEKLKIKTPEYFALKYLVSKVKKWQKEARVALSTQEMISALDAVLSAMKKKCAMESKNLSKQNTLVTCSLENLNKLKISPVVDTKTNTTLVDISREALLNLRQLMIIGDSYELTTVESSQIWVLLDASKQTLLPDDDPNAIKRLHVNVTDDSQTLKSKLGSVKRAPMKQKQKARTQVVSRAKVKKPTQQNLSVQLQTTKVKTVTKRKNTFKKGSAKAKDNKAEGGGLVEEHEPGESCAAGQQCTLPIEESVDWIQCDGQCGKWFHMRCVDLTHQDVNEEDEFICIPCLNIIRASGEKLPIQDDDDVNEVEMNSTTQPPADPLS